MNPVLNTEVGVDREKGDRLKVMGERREGVDVMKPGTGEKIGWEKG